MKDLRQIPLTPDDYERFKPYFPNTIHELITVCGKDATFALVNHSAGQSFRVGKNSKRQAGQALFRKLADIVGERAAQRISIAYGEARQVYIPVCEKVRIIKRNKMIIDRFNEITKHSTGNHATSVLIDEFGLTDRAIQYILNKTE